MPHEAQVSARCAPHPGKRSTQGGWVLATRTRHAGDLPVRTRASVGTGYGEVRRGACRRSRRVTAIHRSRGPASTWRSARRSTCGSCLSTSRLGRPTFLGRPRGASLLAAPQPPQGAPAMAPPSTHPMGVSGGDGRRECACRMVPSASSLKHDPAPLTASTSALRGGAHRRVEAENRVRDGGPVTDSSDLA